MRCSSTGGEGLPATLQLAVVTSMSASRRQLPHAPYCTNTNMHVRVCLPVAKQPAGSSQQAAASSQPPNTLTHLYCLTDGHAQ